MLKEGEPTQDVEIENSPESEVERGVLIIKPDALELGIQGEVFQEIENLGLEIIQQEEVVLNEEKIFQIWPDIYGKDWIKRTVDYLALRPVIVCVIQGEEAIDKMLGLKRSLREKYPNPDKVITVIHTSDSKEESIREQAIFLKKEANDLELRIKV